MSGFDFRDMLGGAAAKVAADPALADGVRGDDVDGLHAHIMTKRDGMPQLVEAVSASLVMTANINCLCLPGFMALMIAWLGQRALRELDEKHGPAQRQHMIDEVQAMLDAMRRGDA